MYYHTIVGMAKYLYENNQKSYTMMFKKLNYRGFLTAINVYCTKIF